MDKPLSTNRKRGVALLVVVGLLALLMISSVAFVTMMRIERAGASNFRHAVSAREMVNVAVGRFLGDIDGAHPVPEARIDDDIYPPWTNHTWIIPGSKDASGQEKVDERETLTDIPEEIVFSVNPDRADAARAHVLSERMMDFVPGYFRPDVAKARPEWAPIEVDGRVVGRYAYIALNTSGMLDINAVASNGVERANGHDPAEIRIDGLSDVKDAAAFSSKRDAIGGYMTLEQVAALGNASGLDDENLENFVPFSYIPGGTMEYIPEELEPDGKDDVPKLWVGGTYSEMDKQCQKDFGGKNFIDKMFDILTDSGRTDEKTFMIGQKEMVGNLKPEERKTEVNRRALKFIASFLDYIDSDDVPNANKTLKSFFNRDEIYGFDLNDAFSYPCVENIAQIAEIGVTADVQLDPGPGSTAALWKQCRAKVKLLGIEIRAWNVMDKNDLGAYSVKLVNTKFETPSITMNPANVAPRLTPSLVSACNEMTTSFSMPDPVDMDSNHSVIIADDDSVSGVGTMVNLGNTPTTGVNPTSTRITKLSFVMTTDIELYRGDTKVDEVKGLSFVLESPKTGPLVSIKFGDPSKLEDRAKFMRQWAEAADPRINWDTRDSIEPRQWLNGSQIKELTGASEFTTFANSSTYTGHIYANPEEMAWPVDPIAKDKNLASSSGKFPPAANKPLQSVGELAFIPLADLPFSTMRLVRHADDNTKVKSKLPNWNPPGQDDPQKRGYHRLYDFFTVSFPDSDAEFRGLVNPNSRQTDVIGAVFDGMPADEWASSPTRLTEDQAYQLADKLVSQARSDSGNSLQSASDLGGLDWLDAMDKAGITLKSEAEREGLLRNSIGLFSTRQQSFLVLLRADAFSTRFGQTSIKQGSVLSTAQAVALVWRDPVADEDGYHPCFIQMLKIIADDED